MAQDVAARDDDVDLFADTVLFEPGEVTVVDEKAMALLQKNRRDRVVATVVQLVMDMFITTGIPPQYFPGTEPFKRLMTQVRATMIAHDF
jgi:hypothetical protein